MGALVRRVLSRTSGALSFKHRLFKGYPLATSAPNWAPNSSSGFCQAAAEHPVPRVFRYILDVCS